MTDAERLKEYDEEEWRDVVRNLRPDWSDEEMDERWEEFLRWMHKREMH